MKGPAIAALLGGLALWTLPATSYSPAFHPDHNAEFLNPGEMLLHSVHSPHDFADNLHLPMASLLGAFVENHSPAGSRRAWRLLDGLAAYALVLALGIELGGWTRGCAAAALLLASPLLRLPGASPRPAAWHGAYIYFHSFYFLLLGTVAGLCVRRERNPSVRAGAALGLALGATFLYRSVLFFFPPVLALRDWALRRRSPKSLAAILILPYLFLLPWIGMNWMVHGRFVPLEESEAGENVVAAALGLPQKYDAAAVWRPSLQGSVLPWAAGQVLQHPLRYARGCLLRFGLALKLEPVLIPLALLACLLRRRREDGPLALLAAYLLLLHCSLGILPEYLEPLAPLLAALAAGLLPARAAERSSKALSGALLTGALSLLLAIAGFTAWRVGAYALAASADELEAAVQRHPRDSWLVYERGYRELLDGRVPEAVADMERSLALRPDYPNRAAALAWARLLSGKPGPFLEWARSARPEPLTDPWFLRLHGLSLADPRTPLADEAPRGCSPSSTFLLERGRVWLRARPSRETLGFLGALTQAHPDCADLWLEEAETAARAGDRKTGLAAVARARALGLGARSGAVLWSLGDSREALELLDGKTLIDLAAKERDRGRALAALDRASALVSDSAQRHRLAGLYSSFGQSAKSLALLDELIAAGPDPAERASLLNDRGVARALAGRTEDAVLDLREAIALSPDRMPAYVTLGGIYASKKKIAEAIQVYDAALGRTPPAGEMPLQQMIREDRDRLGRPRPL